jgi:Ferritin-like
MAGMGRPERSRVRNRHERHLVAEPLPQSDEAAPLKSLLPGKPPELGWRDYLVMLLQIGAEIEHALMVEYLYAAYSLGGSQVSTAGGRSLVLDWRTSILTVAKEEMGHLLTVQNLLCLLGGPPSFEREDYPWDSPFYPFPFCLEKLSLESLACYVYAEMPRDLARDLQGGPEWQHFEAEDRQMIEKIVTDRAKDAGWEEPHHVGEIYDAILEILEDPTLVPDSCFDADTYALQASWDEWGQGYRPQITDEDAPVPSAQPNVIVAQMASRTEAIAGLKAIAGQGEAPHLRDAREKTPSHFDRFLEIFQSFEAAKDPTLVRPAPTNPSTRPSGEGTYIASDTSRAWANLFNVRYRLLLAYLAHTYRLTRLDGERGARAALLQRVFAEMFNVKTIAEVLVRLTLCDPNAPERAGAPFEMAYTTALPPDEVDCWRLYRDVLETAMMLSRGLLAAMPAGEGADYLRAVLELGRDAVAWLDAMIVGPRGQRLVRA